MEALNTEKEELVKENQQLSGQLNKEKEENQQLSRQLDEIKQGNYTF
jgi:hypothetical protein